MDIRNITKENEEKIRMDLKESVKNQEYFNSINEWLTPETQSKFIPLHKDMVIEGDLDISDLKNVQTFFHLAENINIKGALNLAGCKSLRSLPTGLTVGWYLDLSGCTSLTSLPEGLTVGGDLYLNGCSSLAGLPTGLNVGGNLMLRGCISLRSLPSDLHVGRRILYIEGCTSMILDYRNIGRFRNYF